MNTIVSIGKRTNIVLLCIFKAIIYISDSQVKTMAQFRDFSIEIENLWAFFFYKIDMWYISLQPEFVDPMSKFKDSKPRIKAAKNRVQLNASLNLETLNMILSGTNQL